MSWQERATSPRVQGHLSIGEICRRTGLSARTVRYYEELGLLPGVRRCEGGRRVYAGDELERLHFIRRLKTLGLSLSEIKQLNAVYAIEGSTRAMLQTLDELLATRLVEVEQRIGALEGLRAEMHRYRAHVRGRIGPAAGEPARESGAVGRDYGESERKRKRKKKGEIEKNESDKTRGTSKKRKRGARSR